MQGLQNRIKRLAELELIDKHKWKNTQVKEWWLVECIKQKIQTDKYNAHK
jgi:hypothetical protein